MSIVAPVDVESLSNFSERGDFGRRIFNLMPFQCSLRWQLQGRPRV
jgi:hypothetical protein